MVGINHLGDVQVVVRAAGLVGVHGHAEPAEDGAQPDLLAHVVVVLAEEPAAAEQRGEEQGDDGDGAGVLPGDAERGDGYPGEGGEDEREAARAFADAPAEAGTRSRWDEWGQVGDGATTLARGRPPVPSYRGAI
jgi:hypothetical protein